VTPQADGQTDVGWLQGLAPVPQEVGQRRAVHPCGVPRA